MLVGTYNPSLVLVSLGVAILASYTALGMANRVKASSGLPAAKFWLAGGAFAMGIGIWSMHFVGMLAFSLPIPMGYDLPLTVLSLAIASDARPSRCGWSARTNCRGAGWPRARC